MRVKGLGKEYAELLRVVGVDTVTGTEIPQSRQARRKPWPRPTRSANWCGCVPTEKAVGRWIEEAKKLPLKITY